MGLPWGPGFPFTEARQDPTLEALPKLSSPQLLQLDPDSPESNQFDVSRGCVSGRVLGAAVVAQCRGRGVCGRCKCCSVRERCRCCAVCGRCRHRAVMVRCSCFGVCGRCRCPAVLYVGSIGAVVYRCVSACGRWSCPGVCDGGHPFQRKFSVRSTRQHRRPPKIRDAPRTSAENHPKP